MKREHVTLLTRKYLNKNGLDNWEVGFQRKKRIMATCYHTSKVIKFSTWYVDNNTCKHIMETTLHEIGHALIGRGYGHSLKWKDKCKSIGLAEPREFVDNKTIVFPEPKYRGNCICNFKHERDRIPKKRNYCARCYDKIIWTETKSNKLVNFITS